MEDIKTFINNINSMCKNTPNKINEIDDCTIFTGNGICSYMFDLSNKYRQTSPYWIGKVKINEFTCPFILKYVLSNDKKTFRITQSAEIVLGFYSNKDIKFDIVFKTSKDEEVFRFKQVLKKNTFMYPTCGIIFSMATPYYNVYLISDEELSIYMFFGGMKYRYSTLNDYKIYFETYKKNYISYGLNMSVVNENEINKDEKKIIICTPINDYFIPEDYIKEKTLEFTSIIKNELLEIALHPTRLSWFLSIDEINKYIKK